MSNPAEVCRQNNVRSPDWTAWGLSHFRTSLVTSTSPRPRVEMERISTTWRIALFAAAETAAAWGTFRESWRCWGARAPAVDPCRGQNAAHHPYHLDHSGRRRRAVLALQHGLGLLPGRRTRDDSDHRPHPRVTWVRLASQTPLHSGHPIRDDPAAIAAGSFFCGQSSLEANQRGCYLRQITPARNPSPIARAS